MKGIWLTLSGLILIQIAFSQTCQFKIEGQVRDELTGQFLEFTNIYIDNIEKGGVTNEEGRFLIEQICAGEYHLHISHIGCASQTIYLRVESDTFIDIHLHHHSELLDEVILHGTRSELATQSSSTVQRSEIEANSQKSLAEIASNIAGVGMLKNGSQISKPIIHGLFGNRISILNNGIAQSGQQWGNDHAPEVDPMIANKITVIKGVQAIAFPGSSLGGVVLIESGDISDDPHLHGFGSYHLQSNGLGHGLNTQMEKKGKYAKWRIGGTLKLNGDQKTPDYFLTNTGSKEFHSNFLIRKDWNEKQFSELYLSTYNTQLGILRGSHIGNLTDLQEAFTRSIPFFTENDHSYHLQAPKQKVHHHLVKFKQNYLLDERTILKFTYAAQLNIRKEFDVRRSGRTDIPSLSLTKYSHYLEGQYAKDLPGPSFLKFGIQANVADNTNNGLTGIFPLIPDYREFKGGLFTIYQFEKDDWLAELGGKIEIQKLLVLTFDQQPELKVVRISRNFHPMQVSGGISYSSSPLLKLNLNIGYVQRPPAVNELYSVGLHQGVSGIEEGDRNLKMESAIKATLNADFNFGNKIFIQALSYIQKFNNYIFLQPQQDYRLTIRGAFPVYLYKQTAAEIYGADFIVSYAPSSHLKWVQKASFIKGINTTENIPIINIPSFNYSSTLKVSLPDAKNWKKNNAFISGAFVGKQINLLDNQDFLPAPNQYFLLSGGLSTNIDWQGFNIDLSMNAENILNNRYREYLNRLRYFADERGVNLNIRMQVNF